MEDSNSSLTRHGAWRALTLLVLLAADGCWGSERLYRFNLPAASLPEALRSFHLQSGLSVVFQTHRTWVAVRTHAVVGEYTPIQALDRMLEGTALTFGYDTENSILVQETAYFGPDNTLVEKVLAAVR